MKYFTITALLSIGFNSNAVEFVYPKEPNCPAKATKEIWKKNFDMCLLPFKQHPIPDINMGNVADFCTCVADGIVNFPTCEEREKRKDKTYSMNATDAITARCLEHVPIQYPPEDKNNKKTKSK